MLASGVVANEEAFRTDVNSFGLGPTALVTPLSMANAFGTLMNDGLHVAPRYVLDSRTADGAVLERAPEQPETVRRALPEEIADQVVEAMSGVTAPGGTARRARQDFPVYGKTGTTNDSTDAWFIGCAREPHNLCIATWMGYEDQTCDGVQGRACGGMKNVNGERQVYGGTLPAEIFDRTFEILRQVQARKAREEAGQPEVSVPAPEAEPQHSAAPRREQTQAPAPEPASTPVRTAPPPAPASPEPQERPASPAPTRSPGRGGGVPLLPDPDPSPG
jgi:membrane peptidoglycan carboxypeptidase